MPEAIEAVDQVDQSRRMLIADRTPIGGSHDSIDCPVQILSAIDDFSYSNSTALHGSKAEFIGAAEIEGACFSYFIFSMD